MDLGLSEEQELLKNSAREFLEKECPEEHVRAMEEDEKGYSPELWKKMADLGWQGLMIPEEHGGAGFSFLDLAVLVEEFGRALVPGPFIPNQVAAAIILAAGSDAQKKKYLPKLADGSSIFTYAFTEPSGRWDRDGVQMKLEGGKLNGTKLFVPDAAVADYIVTAARKGNDMVAVVVPRSAVQVTVLKTIASDKQAEVVYKDVAVADDDVMAVPQAVGDTIRNQATVLECAYLVGLAQKDFEISVNYAKERVQFGRPIGSFQAIQHKAADMVTDVDGMRFIMYKAAWATSEGEDSAQMDVAMAKAWCSDASRRVVAHGQQIHGGIGFTKDYVIQLFFRRQKRAELFWGDGDFHRERVAQMLEI
ncbi:MAG: acyl-CoA/acyl-ACP dehydrogenase [Dehalococcoidia bacterium]|jgi:alkylation response protein AidB-like acyl-CoA dehydrogenase|uniref:acyl-CoA dehydrogenase family protein n=1 Tax=Candidatus Amarobacter glycogenicus TaxID=3140699 RepID=UPI002A0D6FCA|nr:acyl-CoA/acyl-ACP dehydrogenase [Dehalococcoidia bacterium]MBK7125377.1 acyl-CoA/acyl-ACP dehydrogenase [Dehalococcoidia bacterium]MBK7328859.1 acyl-CoA/acyl-ACP dehydrogenase [Dehalococcoidia bacterium]MBK9611960.1 acyl-CoA/acyl-ACP dehydrogenase [Dehalococcoidia bacterium]